MDRVIQRVNALLAANREIGRAAADAHAHHADRIFSGGIDASGAMIGGGTYSPRYALYRAKRGRDTSPITLRFKGDMERSYVLQLLPDGTWASVFLSQAEAQKAEWNEERYGQKIFGLSAHEKGVFTQGVQSLVRRHLGI